MNVSLGRIGYAALGLLIGAQIVGGTNTRQTVRGLAHTISVGENPRAIAVDAQTARAFVLNRGNLSRIGIPTGPGSVSVLDTHSGTLLRTVPVGVDPNAVAVDLTGGYVFVVNGGPFDRNGYQSSAGSVSVLDAHTGLVVRNITVGIAPVGIIVNQQARHVLVLNRGNIDAPPGDNYGSVSDLDPLSGRLLHTIPVGFHPVAIAIDALLGRAFVANFLSNSVSVLDARRSRLLDTITLGPSPGTVAALAVDERRERALVLSLRPNVTAGGGSSFGRVATIDAGTGHIVRVVPVPEPVAIAVDQQSGHAFVTSTTDNGGSVLMLDARGGTILHTEHIQTYPGTVFVNAQDHRAYVTTAGHLDRHGVPQGRGSVSIFDTRTGRFRCSTSVGVGPVDVAIDVHTGYTFVVNEGENSVTMLRFAC